MEELIKFIVTNIVNNSKDVSVSLNNDSETDNRENYLIKANNSDLGILIGKNGSVIKDISNIVKIKSSKNGKYVVLTIDK